MIKFSHSQSGNYVQKNVFKIKKLSCALLKDDTKNKEVEMRRDAR